MTPLKIFTDRSRILQGQRCPRSRWWAYHAEGQGLAPGKTPLPLGVGSAVHAGLAVLVWEGQAAATRDGGLMAMAQWLPFVEDAAVAAALADLTTYHPGGLELDTGEVAAQQQPTGIVTDADDMMRAQLAASLGMTVADAGLDALMTTSRNGRATFDAYLWAEQCALVEGMVRAYARRRLRPLLEEFEVLEVEREGEWELVAVAHDWVPDDADDPEYSPTHCKFCGRRGHEDMLASTLCYSLRFMSRPDALLRSRAEDSLYILSFKTAASWDVRKAKDAEHDMQGLSEGVEVERRLAEWWAQIRETEKAGGDWDELPDMGNATFDYLRSLPAPPRILGIRMEFLLKGSRWKDKDLSAKVGFDAWSQRSHLVRYYEATSVPRSKTEAAFAHGDRCWAWDFIKSDGTESHLAWQNWRSRPAWELAGGVRVWIDALDDAEMAMSAYDSTTGMEPREMGWKSRAQTMGYTSQHPLDAAFIPPITIYRNSDELLDWVEQTEYAERRVAEGVAAVNAAADEGERRSLLNQHFPMSRQACQWPSSCFALGLCFGSDSLRADPLSSELFKIRIPNHPVEADSKE